MAANTTIELLDDDDLLDPRILNAWIRKNKKASAKNIPPMVTEHFARIKKIPPTVAGLLPVNNLPVLEFIQFHLPDIENDIVHPKTLTWFREEPSNCEDFSQLMRTSIPPKSLVDELVNLQEQAILDGYNSFVNPRHPTQRFPLFAPNFLQDVHNTLEAQREWKASIRVLPWKARVDLAFASSLASTLTSSRLLSDRWLSSSLVDLMVGQLSDRLTEDDDQDDRVAIEPLRLMEYLERPEQHDKALRRIASNLRDKDCVLFVSHWMKKRHWVTFKVDINRAQITYADGIPDNPRPRELLKRLTGWLNTEFKKTFKALDPGNIMRHGIQDDFYNCGIVAVNAIEYELFKSEVWTSQKKVFHRVRWFNDLSRAFFKQIGQDLDAIQHNSIPRGILELLNPTSSKHMSMDISTILNPVSSISRSCMHISSLSQSDSNASTQTSSLDSSAHIQLLSSTSDTSMPILSPDPSSRMHISSLMNPPSTSESSTSSQLSLKRPGSPIVRSHNQDASVNELDDPPDESSDFALTEEEEEEDADSVVTAQTDDEFYAASSKGLGVAKSSIWAREQNLRFQRTEGQNGSKDPKHYARMRKLLIKARKLDPHAEVITAKLIRHSKCGKNHKLDVPYKISNFRKHVKQHCNGKGNTAGAGSRSIDSFFKPLGGIAPSKDQSTSRNTKSSQTPRHCPGLSEADHRGIGLLLDRTGALGGGAPSVTVLSKRLYGCSYKKLSLRRKRAVKMAQRREWKWEYHHDHGRVYSTSCTRTLSYNEHDGPCFSCFSLLLSKSFRVSIAVKKPSLENYKYLNKEFRNETLSMIFARSCGLEDMVKQDPTKTPALKYALCILEGKFADRKQEQFFGDLLNVMNTIQEKRERGVGKEGFQWSPLITQVAQTVAMISPAAYNALKPFIPLPEIRTLQRQRAKLSKLPVDIQPRTFVLARAHLDALGYSGPVALSCDDTKLQPAFRPFYDEDRQSWCILGSTGVPAVVADPEEYCKMVHEAGIQKATKLRLWCMTPCCPGVSPYILAAKAIPNTLTVPVLFKYSDDLIRGLLAEGILVCSYACDGTVVERNIQHQLEQSAESTITHNIYDPRSKNPTIVIRIPVIAGQAMALIQDDLHLLKTIRNNVFSGAHLLVFPNCVVLYRQVREIALQKGPLYNRDVGSNSDKQDDNAALRFCSANTLEWLVSGEHYSDENIGLIVYIFVFGELIDTFQSRTISLAERARMVLRAYFFLDIWERFLDVAGYPKSKYFLSRDSIDIIRILIRGFFQIILIHRDHLPKQHPVFPHIIGTSICEHVFGISRKIDPDFTMYSWYILLPKIMLMLRNAVQLSEQGKDGKARASGYNHSYLDRHGIDVAALSAFPSDSELDDASRAAYDDAISLFSLLGLSPEELEGSSSLPSISSWFTPSSTEPPIHVRNSQMHEPSDDESCCGIDSGETSDESDDDTEPRLQSLVDAAESIEPDTNSENRELMRYRFAAVALEIDKDLAIGALPEEDEASQMENISNDIECIGELLAASLPVPNHDDAARPHFTPLDLMDLSKLSAIRKSHETRLAASATRTFCGITPEPDAGNKTGPELHIKLAFQKIINDEARKDHAEGSGVLRKLRWTTAKGSTEVDGEQVEESTGNAANAASAAKSRATASLTKRRKAYETHTRLPDFLAFGRITEVSPIVVDSKKSSGYGFAIVGFSQTDSKDHSAIVVCRVLSLYEKIGTKSARHGLVDRSANIAALSYLAVQTYEPGLGGLFRATKNNFQMALSFAHISPDMFLCALSSVPATINGNLRLSHQDRETYQQISANLHDLRLVMKKLTSRVKSR